MFKSNKIITKEDVKDLLQQVIDASVDLGYIKAITEDNNLGPAELIFTNATDRMYNIIDVLFPGE